MAGRVLPETNGNIPQCHRTNQRTTVETTELLVYERDKE